MPVIPRLTFDEAVLAALTAGMPADTPGDYCQAPPNVTDGAGRINRKHWVLRPLPSGVTEVSLDDPHAIVRLEYQLDANGSNARQSQWVADRLRAAWIAETGGTWTYPLGSVDEYVVDRTVALFGGPNSDAPGAYSTIDNLYLVVN
jgi:hypothetical protein